MQANDGVVEKRGDIEMNQGFSFHKTELPGLIQIASFNMDDPRGCFTKDYSKEIFQSNGIQYDLAEVFYSTSCKGVIRGLHFQRVMGQPKLIRCISGHIWDVAVDLRRNSPTFKHWKSFELTGQNCLEILIPIGFAHGFLALEESVVSYKCAEKFYGEYDDGILWDDPGIGVKWPLELVGGRGKVILSDKDRKLQSFRQFMDIYGGF